MDAAGIYLAGLTVSPNFPPAAPPFQDTKGADYDAFVTKLNPAGSALVYSTYLGGSGTDDGGCGIAVDAAGNAYVTGYTARPTSRPPTRPCRRTNGGGPYDAFVAKLNADGSALVYSTYLGGSGDDRRDRHRRGRRGQRLRDRLHRLDRLPDRRPLPGRPAAAARTPSWRS